MVVEEAGVGVVSVSHLGRKITPISGDTCIGSILISSDSHKKSNSHYIKTILMFFTDIDAMRPLMPLKMKMQRFSNELYK